MKVLSRRRWVAVLTACSVLLLASAVLGLVSGPSGLAFSDVVDALRGHHFFMSCDNHRLTCVCTTEDGP